MNQFKYSLIFLIVFCFLVSCSNADQKQTRHTENPTAQVDKEVTADEVSNDQSEEFSILKQKEQDEQQAREEEDNKATEKAEKAANKLKAKQESELRELKAKGVSDVAAKKLQEKQAKELADLKEKELTAKNARAESDNVTKEKSAQGMKKEKDRLTQEAKEKTVELEAAKKAKEQADKLTREEADKIVKEQNEKKQVSSSESANSIIDKVDKNMSSKTQITTSEMIIYGKRNDRTISSKGYAEGNSKSFTEYLSPAREKGTKMLKLDDRLWIYSPSTDRTIQLSGHMLRQSVMGSDLSYEDLMEDRKLVDTYSAKVIDSEDIDGRKTWKLELIAKVEDVAYYKRMLWVDQERYVPLKEELYAKSGQLLKRTTLSNVVKIDGRWFPKKVNYKDVLKSGKGTDFIVIDIEFNANIPAHIFSKGSLKK